MDIILGIKVPTNDTIKSRTSTIAKSLATSIIPRIEPTQDEINRVKAFFPVDGELKLKCAYCSDPATEWDHFHPLIKDKKPSGYVTEIFNLVPCCRNCNSSKGNREWRDWMENSNSEKSPQRRKDPELIKANKDRLEEYDDTKKFPKRIIEWSNVDGFKKYWENYDKICEAIDEAQNQAEEVKKNLATIIELDTSNK